MTKTATGVPPFFRVAVLTCLDMMPLHATPVAVTPQPLSHAEAAVGEYLTWHDARIAGMTPAPPRSQLAPCEKLGAIT